MLLFIIKTFIIKSESFLQYLYEPIGTCLVCPHECFLPLLLIIWHNHFHSCRFLTFISLIRNFHFKRVLLILRRSQNVESEFVVLLQMFWVLIEDFLAKCCFYDPSEWGEKHNLRRWSFSCDKIWIYMLVRCLRGILHPP